MIFYFTGTGNSEYAAKRLLKKDEQLISITKATWNEAYTYEPAEDETVGFVFPVYFYGLPDTVRSFVKKVRFATKPAHVYAVITCGGSIAGAGDLLGKFLAEGGTTLNAVYSVKMPDNYVLMYDVTTEEEEKPILAAADERLDKIRKFVRRHREYGTKASVFAKAETALLYPMYDLTRNTAKFYTDDKCVSCGTCAARCPAKAIQLIDGKPTWIKEKCDHCLSCVRCNAVQYGKRTVDAYRYKHPSLRKKKVVEPECCCSGDGAGHGGHGDHAH